MSGLKACFLIPCIIWYLLSEVSLTSMEELTPSHILPVLKKIHGSCGTDEINVTVEFNKPFLGVIYSKGFFDNNNCFYVKSPAIRPIESIFTFQVPLTDCGSEAQTETLSENRDWWSENTIIIQNDPYIQENYDQAVQLRCVWKHTFLKTCTSN
ncbi:uncharacterized protein LOC143227388 [Tachypleus tridentatus]|uniref:uncharacterized protein LOC143227388 n=1 Tax=Tachypleus tridentatus TaxID=6853 RepID=UPI003FD2FE6A